MNVFQLSRQFKADLLRQERAASAEILQSYSVAYRAIEGSLDKLTAKMEEARRSGKTLSQSWLFQQHRLRSLLQQTHEQIARFSGQAAPLIQRQRIVAIRRAQEDARRLTAAALDRGDRNLATPVGQYSLELSVSWNVLPFDSLHSLVGALGPDSPLTALFDGFGPDASSGVRGALVRGVATGQGAREVARGVRDALGEPLTRALTISRTEILRSYREASIASYAANDDVVEKWRWTATKTARTCAMCIAMDGQEFDFETPFGSHPACRCVPVPVTKSWEELGITGVPETRSTIETGTQWFEKQPEAVQLQILGPAKFALFQSGDLELSDLVGYREDPAWGPVRFEKSLKSLAT